MEINLLDIEIGGVSFRHMPEPTYADMRPIYRVSLIAHLIDTFSRNFRDGKRLTYLQINILTWLLNNQDRLSDFTEGRIECLSLDPFNILAINYGAAHGFFAVQDEKINLTDKGLSFHELIKNKSIFANDESALMLITKKMISSSRLIEMYKGGL